MGIWKIVSLKHRTVLPYIHTCRYFTSKFHVFDASIIVISFVFEVTLQGVEEEVASLIIILRLLRVIKIVDEISVGAEEQMKELEDRLNESERDVRSLKKEVHRLRSSRMHDY
jgi:hypothetical protein